MNRSAWRASTALLGLGLACLAACGGPTGSEPEMVASAGPESSAPTTAAPGPCTWELTADEPADAAVAPGSGGAASGDSPEVAPHQAENDQWRQRRDVTAAQVAEGTALAERLRPVLVDACEAGDFSPERLADSLAVAAGWTVFTIQPRSAMGDTSTGVELALDRAGTCLVGDTTPGTVRVHVTGPIADGGCWEPPSS
ncbi:MAG: hypothetical protein P1U38_12445 [Aeromicrobium sp.]|uniref:hypothetical protein n=1 Tax=Aeromicrobium sp. TaxID=1871063 RepID=UPI002635050C|nr:hypothetical protein [Aeromicrobium sp.]MDF1705573.1 hypothetical protein [Aeromicrobium sp.]